MVSRSWLFLISGLVILSLLVSALACAKATPIPTVPAAPPVAPATPPPGVVAPSPTPPPAPVVKPTGELRIAWRYLEGELLDPILSSSTAKPIYELIFDWLVGFSDDGRVSTATGISEKWERTTPTTWTFYLRKGIKFHNGDEVTAEDAKFSIERVMSPKSVTSYAGTFRTLVKSMEVPNPYTLVIHTKEPYAFLDYDLSGVLGQEGVVLPKKYLQEKGDDYFSRYPVGTGPYKFVEQMLGSYFRLEAAGNHWREGVPKYKTVTYFLVPEEYTRIAMLKIGQADVIDVGREAMKALGDFNVFLKDGADAVGIKAHSTWLEGSALKDKRVRQALNLAVNKDDIAKFLFLGMAKPTGGFPIGSWSLGYEPLPPTPYDPERAKQLLTEAGYPKGFEITLYSFQRQVAEGPEVVVAVSAQFEKIGLKTKIIHVDYPTYRTVWRKGQLPINTVGWHDISNRAFAHGLLRILHHSAGDLTITKISELDQMIEAAEAAKDVVEYAARVNKAQKYIYDNYFHIPLVETGPLFATTKKITRWNLGQNLYATNLTDLIRR